MTTAKEAPKDAALPVCGIVRPISALEDLNEAHWIEVQEILEDAIEEAGFTPNLVSSAHDVGVIQKRIVQNLYDNPVVVCDVSAGNPSVMFELGLRLAFDKPTLIVKDDRTKYSFDTSPIEHLEYPRDLRFPKIVDFKQKLSEKIRSTHDLAAGDPGFSTFLKHFGDFKKPKIDQTELPAIEFIIEELRSLRSAVEQITSASRASTADWEVAFTPEQPGIVMLDYCCKGLDAESIAEAVDALGRHAEVGHVRLKKMKDQHRHIIVYGAGSTTRELLQETVKNFVPVGSRLKAARTTTK